MSEPSGVAGQVQHLAGAERPRIALLVPCLNESLTIGKVIDDFRAALPEAEIYVFDNNSTDDTARIARERGCVVFHEPRPGKGHVTQAMFRKVQADLFVMVDGDDTYSARDVRRLLEPVQSGRADMAVGTRLQEFSQGSFRALHVFGNRVLTGIVNSIFQSRLSDMMSGYRAMSRELVCSTPVLSSGFEVETELTIRALEQGFTILEVPLAYQERPAGSSSKLRTFRDGLRVMASIVNIFRSYKPFTFFGSIGLFFLVVGLGVGTVVILDYFDDRYVEHVPLAILATGCMILSFFTFGIGILLNTINERMREIAYTQRSLVRGGR
ncbi:MAG: glycosyltransferase [Candidatus Lambdaproteobacteria bacterium]|nr:glycosyltransferase [Candidatus Lambdaproteobacteria bacterium]